MDKTSKIFYTLHKNNELKGYLLGSLHMLLNPEDYEIKKEDLAPYFDKCKTFIFEVDTQRLYTQLPFGIERVAYELLESKQDKSIVYLESLAFQRAMLGMRIFFGESIIQLPWHSYNLLKKYAKPIIFANKFCSFFARLYNTAYNMFFSQKHSLAVHEFQKEQQQISIKFFKEYQQEKFTELSHEDKVSLCIEERHDDWIEILRDNTDIQGPIFITVGVAHLPGEKGLIKLLEQEGYELTPQTLHLNNREKQSTKKI